MAEHPETRSAAGESSRLLQASCLVERQAAQTSIVANRYGPAVLIDRDIDDLGFGHQGALRRVTDAIGFYNHPNGDRSAADSNQVGVEADQIPDKDGSYEDYFMHGFGHDFLEGVLAGLDCCGYIDVAEYHPAEDRPVSIGVFGHQHDSNGGIQSPPSFGIVFRVTHSRVSVARAFQQCQTDQLSGTTAPLLSRIFAIRNSNFAFPLLLTSRSVSVAHMQEERVAAGGVVIATGTGGTSRVLLVHRPAYDDWSFPKGKADPGETIEQTALREVEEETGLACRIVRELGATRYDYRSRKGSLRPKVVHYFLMEQVDGAVTTDGDEVDLAEWLQPAEAERRLTYDIDRELLSRAVASE